MEVDGSSWAEEFINAFLVPFSRGHQLSNEGDRALKLCTLLAFPPPPPGSVVQDVDLPPHLEAVGPEQLSGVVLDLAEGYVRLPSGLCPNCRVIVEELLPALEELTRIPKCTWCLYPSPTCTCGGVQAQAQHQARGPPEDPPPPYQLEALTTIQSTPVGSTHQPTAGTPSSGPSHAQTPGRAYFQWGITYPMPILGAPEEPPPMWMPAAVGHGLRPTIEPLFQATMTPLQRTVHRMPPPPGLTLPVPAIPALMSLTPTSGPTHSVTSASTTHTRDTTASTGPSVSSSFQRESRGHGLVRIQGPTQVGSSQVGTQQSSQGRRPSHSRRHAQSQGRSQSQACSQSQARSPSQSQSQRQTQTTTPSEGGRQARAPATPSSSSSVAPQATAQGDGHQETAMDTSEAHPRDGEILADKWGSLARSMMKALICPRVRGGRRTTPPSSGTISEGITSRYPWPSSGRFMNQSSSIWGPTGSFGLCSRRRTPCS